MMRFFRAWYKRWKVHDVMADAQTAVALRDEAQRRLYVAQNRERVIEARGDELSKMVRRAMGGDK